MSDNPILPFDEPLRQVVEPTHEQWHALSNEERYQRFHDANPQVMQRLVGLARHLRSIGIKRAGIKLLFERLRWQYLETHGDPYKLNNTYTAFYARQIMRDVPELDGFFELRESPHDKEFYRKAS